MKIDRLTLEEQNKLLNMKAQGITGQEIADTFNAEKGTDMTANDVNSFVSKRKNNAVKVLQKSGEIEQQLAKQHFDSIEQLNSLNRDMWDAFTQIKESPEYKQSSVICPHCQQPVKVAFKSAAELVKAADHLMKQIEHVDKVLNRLKTTGLNVTYNITELTQQINKVIPDMLTAFEKRGDIKIKKKKILIKEQYD